MYLLCPDLCKIYSHPTYSNLRRFRDVDGLDRAKHVFSLFGLLCDSIESKITILPYQRFRFWYQLNSSLFMLETNFQFQTIQERLLVGDKNYRLERDLPIPTQKNLLFEKQNVKLIHFKNGFQVIQNEDSIGKS